jgi:hypothetical protein
MLIDIEMDEQQHLNKEKGRQGELCGIACFLVISYNSESNVITSFVDVSVSNITQKQSAESDEQEIIEIVHKNNLGSLKCSHYRKKYHKFAFPFRYTLIAYHPQLTNVI